MNNDKSTPLADAHVLVRDPANGPMLTPLTPGDVLSLGRAPGNTIVLHDERASRNHAEIRVNEDGKWVIQDLKSRNGTTVGANEITSEHTLIDGDTIQIGSITILFSEGPPPSLSEANENDTDGTGITGEMSAEIAEWHSTIRYRRNRSRLLDDIRESARTAPKVGQAAAELCRLAFTLGRATEVSSAANRALESAMLGSNASKGMVLLPTPEAIHEERMTVTDLYGVAAVPSDLRIDDIPTNLVEAALATDEAILAGPETVGGQPPAITIAAPIRVHGKPVGAIYLSSEPSSDEKSPDDLEFVIAVCDAIGQVYTNLEARETLSTRLATAACENKLLKERLGEKTRMVGESPALATITTQVERVASTKATVLIRGESGAGKELVAQAIHDASDRNSGPFVCLNCAALSETLLESELFGHEKGAFTGATDKKAGKFELADNGTLFLDEIGEMSPTIQAKFLRVLEGHAFERVGGSTRLKVDVRVIAATNRHLEDAVASGGFRRDLYFRLRVVEIAVPPLRKRQEDIELLANHFVDVFSRETGRKIEGLSPAAIRAMQEYHWPGNIRELRNCIERAVVLSSNKIIDVPDLALSTLASPGDTGRIETVGNKFTPETLATIEKRHILATLECTGGNKTKAAKLLGIERSTLDRKFARWGKAD
ncbi:MAG: sigma 54-interacting transcriptional regulator [Pirellulales bacterium]|nr:sigma 54-interacting transcriptional regulator [Pirellulales bacterium]